MTEGKGTDLLGIQPIARAIESTVTGIGSLLGRICKPACDEFGLFLADKVHAWRTANLNAVAKAAEEKLKGEAEGVQAQPRLVNDIVQEASWIDDRYLQDMWGGLLASACTEDGQDDSNLIFVNLLADLTKVQARLLKFACENAQLHRSPDGLIQAQSDLYIDLQKMKEITGEPDIQRLDRELDHLRALELIDGGFNAYTSNEIKITPTSLGLHLYVRCCGSRKSPVDFFNVQESIYDSIAKSAENQGLAAP